MSYIDHTLLPGERVVYRATLHWIGFVRPAFVLVLGVVVLFLVPSVLAVGGVVLLIGILMLIQPLVAYTTTEFGVTTKRVIVKDGFIRRRTLELLLRQVEAISVEQGLTGRVLRFGSITLTGTGGVREVFHRVVDPLELRRQIQGQAA